MFFQIFYTTQIFLALWVWVWVWVWDHTNNPKSKDPKKLSTKPKSNPFTQGNQVPNPNPKLNKTQVFNKTQVVSLQRKLMEIKVFLQN